MYDTYMDYVDDLDCDDYPDFEDIEDIDVINIFEQPRYENAVRCWTEAAVNAVKDVYPECYYSAMKVANINY